MKKWLLLALLGFLCLAVKAQDDTSKFILPIKDSIITYEGIVKLKDTTIDADLMFITAQKWFAETFRDSKSVLQINDKSAGKLLGKGATIISRSYLRNQSDYYLRYTIEIDVKKGKYRYRIYDPVFEGDYVYVASNGYSKYLHGQIKRLPFESRKAAKKRFEGEFMTVDTDIKNLIESLNYSMLKTSVTKSDF